MYVDVVPNRNSKPATLLREGWREGKKVRKRTLANLSHWPQHQIDALRRLLRGEPLASPDDLFQVEQSRPHGHVEALLAMIHRLGLVPLLGARRSRRRDLVLALLVERLLHPSSKLATTRLWHTSTLAEELGVTDAEVEEVYDALDWFGRQQERIETRLAEQYLGEGHLVLYDVSSSTYEGACCPLAGYGHNRDGTKKRAIVYGVLTDSRGCPVAIEVYPGSTGDPSTLESQIDKLRDRFGLSRVVLVGDRGLLTQARIETLRSHPGLGWISTLRSPAIRRLLDEESLQRSLFDEQNLAEIHSPDYPGERLVACFNPVLAEHRRAKREALLAATEAGLERVAADVARRTRKLYSPEQVGEKVGRVLDRFKMRKHFTWSLEGKELSWQRREESLRRECELDGLYVVRTSEPAERLSAEQAVRSYKSLSEVEQAFRCLKGLDLRVRPIYHRLEHRVRAHFFLCLLAYHVEWHLRRAWAPLLFEEEHPERHRQSRDPVAAVKPTPRTRRKKTHRRTEDGHPVHSFSTLLQDLATRCRNTCRASTPGFDTPTFQRITDPSPLQQRALELIEMYPVA